MPERGVYHAFWCCMLSVHTIPSGCPEWDYAVTGVWCLQKVINNCIPVRHDTIESEKTSEKQRDRCSTSMLGCEKCRHVMQMQSNNRLSSTNDMLGFQLNPCGG